MAVIYKYTHLSFPRHQVFHFLKATMFRLAGKSRLAVKNYFISVVFALQNQHMIDFVHCIKWLERFNEQEHLITREKNLLKGCKDYLNQCEELFSLKKQISKLTSLLYESSIEEDVILDVKKISLLYVNERCLSDIDKGERMIGRALQIQYEQLEKAKQKFNELSYCFENLK